MIAVDDRHRIVAEMMVPKGSDAEAVRRELLVILEAVEESRREEICPSEQQTDDEVENNGTDDDDDTNGDEWKSQQPNEVNLPKESPRRRTSDPAAPRRLGRGVYVAPWLGRAGELVLLAISRDQKLVGDPFVVHEGTSRIAARDKLWMRLDMEDPSDS